MKIKLDENLSRHLKPLLWNEGHDATTVADEGLLGKPDEEVGAAASREGRMVFTLDVEFANLLKLTPRSPADVVLFRPRSLGPLAVNRFVLTFVQETDLSALAGCVAVVEPGRVRVRRIPQQ